MVLNQLTSKAQHIFLDGRYSPAKDIRHFVTTEFDRIKAAHPQAHLLLKDWPPEPAINAIVEKSSNQFIYAATVMRYLANPSTVPSLSLERAQGPVLYRQKSPFPQLDAMYTYILQQAEDQEAIRDITSLILLTYHAHWLESLSCAARILPEYHQTDDQAESLITNLLGVYDSRYTHTLVESSISDLAAIVQYQDNKLVFYHEDLADFFVYSARSKKYWIWDEKIFRNILEALLARSLRKYSPGDDVLLNQILETRIRNCGIWIANSTEMYYGLRPADPAYHTSCGHYEDQESWNCVHHTDTDAV